MRLLLLSSFAIASLRSPQRGSTRFAALAVSLCSALISSLAAQPPNMLLGTQAIGGRYHFTKEKPLLGNAKLIAELGSGIMKFSISRQTG